MKKKCSVCGSDKSQYLLNNRLVCMMCDELLFDIEIECEAEEQPKELPNPNPKDRRPTKIPLTIKK